MRRVAPEKENQAGSIRRRHCLGLPAEVLHALRNSRIHAPRISEPQRSDHEGNPPAQVRTTWVPKPDLLTRSQRRRQQMSLYPSANEGESPSEGRISFRVTSCYAPHARGSLHSRYLARQGATEIPTGP